MPGSFLTYPIRSDKLQVTVKVERALLHRKTPFQTIDIVETAAFGRMMFLDGHIQLAELDEHVYHECLVHIPLLNIPDPKAALVIGGGDGGAIRELCRWPLDRIDMVEIDQAVIEASKEFWPELSSGAFDDPRVHVRIDDAFEWVRNRIQEIGEIERDAPESSPRGPESGNPKSKIRNPKSYDVIVLDATDVYEESDSSLSEMLFTPEFYGDCKRLLKETGLLVTQADNPVFCPFSLKAIQAELGKVFERTGSYAAPVPSFGGCSAFCWASREAALADEGPESAFRPEWRYLSPTRYQHAIGEATIQSTKSSAPSI